MNIQIAESTDVRTVETLIKEAIDLGMRVEHKPDNLEALRAEQIYQHQMCLSAEG